jgi:phosphate transport system ATP-binding protein
VTARQPKISVEDLSLAYGAKEVIHGISFELQHNEILGIIGPAQSGKSSLVKCLNRTIEFSANAQVSGVIRFDGEDVRRVKDLFELRRKIGMVAPLPVGLPLSIYDNVAFAPRCAGVSRRAQLDPLVEGCLRQAALWDEVKDHLGKSGVSLSGGQQQRLCIARALAVEPDVLLMDEPCSALDPIATAKIEELILELRGTLTIVIVTHNMQQAGRVAETTGFFLLGELVEFGVTRELFTNPRDKRTEDYITGRFG